MEKTCGSLSRRELLVRAGLVLPAMHAGLLGRKVWAQHAAGASPRFQELVLRVQDVAGQKPFYRDVLELPLVDEGESSLVFRAGATRLRFTEAEGASAPFYHFAFNIPENKLERAMEWMKGRAEILTWYKTGEKVVHFKNWNAHSVYFFDPAGNILEFIAHHPLNNGRDGAFSVDDILRINEIGIVAEDVTALVEELDTVAGARPFLGWSPTFAPIGDRQGLFICVKADRVWLPTKDVHARAYPVEVVLDGVESQRAFELKSAPGARVCGGSIG